MLATSLALNVWRTRCLNFTSMPPNNFSCATRAQGWVALSGLKYGADLVLYQAHPADCHADFCAIALPAEPPPPQGSPGSPNPSPRAPHAGSTPAGAGSSSAAAAAQGGGYGPGGAACDSGAGHGEVDGPSGPAQAFENGHISYVTSADAGALGRNGVASGHAVNGMFSGPAAASRGGGVSSRRAWCARA